MSFKCRRKYRLELHWDTVRYYNDTIAVLEGAYFSGPVLKNAVELVAPDHIDLDMTPQHFVLLDTYYIVKLSWEGVEYLSDDRILLAGAKITNDYLKSLHKLEDQDWILINTEKHEEDIHVYHFVYEAQVMKPTKEPHKYA